MRSPSNPFVSPCWDARRLAESIGFTARVAGAYYLLSAVELEYRFHRLIVQTPGAKVMRWLSVPGHFFYAVGDRSGIVLDKFVAGLLACTFFKLSNLVFKVVYASQRRALALGGLNSILLHGKYLSPEAYQLSSDFIGSRCDLRFIERLCCGPVGRNSLRDTRNQTHDVHRNPPVVEEGCVRASDSTARGDMGV